MEAGKTSSEAKDTAMKTKNGQYQDAENQISSHERVGARCHNFQEISV
jgi:hypothetical protein